MKAAWRPQIAADLRLARIALARCLPKGFWLPFGAFMALTLWVWNQDSHMGVPQEPWLQRAQLRQAAWVLLACLGAPLLIARGARLARDWRHLDADWFGALPVSHWRWVRGSALGIALAGLLLSACTSLLTEWAVQGDAPCGRFERTFEHPGFTLLQGDEPVQWVQRDLLLEELQEGSKLVFRPRVMAGAGPSVELGFHILPFGQKIREAPQARALIFGPSRIAVELPGAAKGPASLALERLSEGAPALLPANHIDLIGRLSSEHWIGVELGLWSLVFLISWTCLAAGLGAWMRPALAAGLCLAGIGLSWWGEAQLGFLPGSAAPLAWTRVGLGWAPGALGAEVWLAALGMSAMGLVLLAGGIARGRQLK